VTAHVIDDLPAYAIGLMREREAAAVRAHLERCASCAAELASTRALLAALPAQLEDASPRADVRAGLRARVLADRAGIHDDTPASLLPFRIDPSSRNLFLRLASLWMLCAFIVGIVGGLTGWALLLGDRLQKRGDGANGGGPAATLRAGVPAVAAHGAAPVPPSVAASAPAGVPPGPERAPRAVAVARDGAPGPAPPGSADAVLLAA